MIDSLYIAWRYLLFHKMKTAILVTSMTLMMYLPVGLEVLVRQSAEQLRDRARTTPLIVGAKGSRLELVLNSLYFESQPPATTSLAQAGRVRATGLARAIPLYVGFQARGWPIVGTTLEYFSFRDLQLAEGQSLAMLGQCVLGAVVAEQLQLHPGDTLTSTPASAFDLAGVYPLKMHVVGILQPAGSPDDRAVFVDLKTAWVIQGLGHGHQDLAGDDAAPLLLDRDGKRLVANASVEQFAEITPENRDSFHFHGDPDRFPITAVIAIPPDARSAALLIGQYLSPEEPAQIVRPQEVMQELSSTLAQVRTFVIAGALLVGVSTVLTAVLVLVLSLRLRAREMATMTKLGCSPFKMASIVSLEIVLVLSTSGVLAASCAAASAQAAGWVIRQFIL